MSREFDEALGKRIKGLRAIRGYSREETAHKAGISTKFLYEVEHGKRGISAERAVRLANVLETSCDFLLKGKLIGDDVSKILLEQVE